MKTNITITIDYQGFDECLKQIIEEELYKMYLDGVFPNDSKIHVTQIVDKQYN